MSKERRGPELHIEWAPGQVRAVDIASGRRWAGASLRELPGDMGGSRLALIGIRRNLVFLKSIGLPKAAPEDLRRILAVQIGQMFPLSPDQLAFDFIQTTDVVADGYATMVAAVRAEDLRTLYAEMSAAGVRAERILPVALGAPSVAERAGFKDALVIEATPTGDYTLDVVKSGALRSSRVAGPGSDIAGEAYRTLAAAGAEGLPLVTIDVESPRLREQGVPSSVTPLDLLQTAPPFLFELDEVRIQEAQRRIATRTRLGTLMMLSALLLVGLVWADRSDAAKVVARGNASWNRELTKLRRINSDNQKDAQDATAQQNVLKSAFDTAQPVGDLTSIIGDAMPTNSWMTGLSVERGKPLQIRGTSSDPNDVAKFLRALAETKRFRDIKLVVANSAKISKTTVVQFNVTAVAIGNLPMPSPAPVKKGSSGARITNRSGVISSSGGSGTGAAASSTATPAIGSGS